MSERELFIAALQIPDPGERSAWLDHACGADAALRQRLDVLLRALDQAGSLLDNPAVAPPAGIEPTGPGQPAAQDPLSRGIGQGPSHEECSNEQPGAVLAGRYKLLEPIAEGGMGTVWMAQQAEPVKRLVAIKLIRAGMDSRQVIARFEAERQALALMDHPNIAKVHDAGTTSDGRPFFVMELVKGVAITRYCDEHRLTPRQRLELFVPVCQAIQHAHQKGIIHRDLKPSNVLVALYDDRPVPKVIDFGVAKATGRQLTEQTLHTGFGAVVGTLEYMSPEQASFNQLDVDTRSDIYSLGVLLYELLTGSPPFAQKELEKAGVLEMLRLIREQEPSKPSTKLSTAEGLPTLAANRGTEPAKLTKLVRGELDWIVMKSLEKDRNRRYETANGFAMDVQRYLADEPVQACPPSALYKFRKFARRNKARLAFATVILFFLVVLLGGVSWTAWDRAARRAVLEQSVLRALEETETAIHRDRLPESAAALKRAEELLASGPCSEDLHVRVHRWRADLDLVDRLEAIRLRRETLFVGGQSDNRTASRDYANAFQEGGLGGEGEEAEAVGARVTDSAVREQLVAALDDWTGATVDPDRRAWLLAVARHADPDPWRDRFRDPRLWQDPSGPAALADELLKDEARLERQKPHLLAELLGDVMLDKKADAVPLLAAAQARHPDDFWLNLYLGDALLDAKQHDEAVGYFRAALAVRPNASMVHNNLAAAFLRTRQKKHLDEAIRECRTAIRLHKNYAAAHSNLGLALESKGQTDEAIAEYREAIRLEKNHDLPHNNLGNALRIKGQLEEAIAELREAIRLKPESAAAHSNLGIALHDKGQLEEAIAESREAIRLDKNNAEAHDILGIALKSKGQTDEAIAEHREAIRLDKNYAIAHSSLGNALVSKGQTDEAIAEYREAIRLDKNYAAAHSNLGLALESKGQTDEAIAEYREAIRLEKNLAEPHNNLGNALRIKGQLEEAIAELREAIRLKPESAEAHNNLGNALHDKGQLHEAIAEHREAIRLDKNNAIAHSNLGTALHDKGQLDEAIAEQQEAIRLDKNYAAAHNNLGTALHDKGQHDEAIAEYREAIRLDKNYADAHSNLGAALHDKGQLNEAVAEFREAIRLNKDNDKVHVGVGAALYAKGKVDEAIAEFREAIRLNKNNAEAHSNLGAALRSKGHLDEAIAEHREAIRLHKNYAAAHSNLGAALESKGQTDEAISEFREAIRLDKNYAKAHSNLGAALASKGRTDEAISEFREAIRLKQNYAIAYSNLAWVFATCADPKMRDPAQAVELAKKAVALDPNKGDSWNTLGVAQYRAGDWKAAITALEKSMELRKGGDANDWFFLAMAHWQRGDKKDARNWYDRAVMWMEKHQPRNEELLRFRAEAETLLELKK